MDRHDAADDHDRNTGRFWNDVRRFNQLNTLPLDKANHTRAKVMPIPQAECLIRANETSIAMKGPGC